MNSDSFNRCKLWDCLRKTGVGGKMYKMLKSIYANVKSCVRHKNGVTDYFDCPIGVKQGCILSPLLFSFFINELSLEIQQNGKHGVQLYPDMYELLILLFADDVILISDTVNGLQTQIDTLFQYTISWKLTVNTDKTKIVVFRKGSPLASREKWATN